VADLILCGVGYHHAGLDVEDRKLVERMFSQGQLAVLGRLTLLFSLLLCYVYSYKSANTT